MATKVVLILGAGGNIGSHVAQKFASEGYKVAVASRRGTSANPAYLPIKANLSDPKTISDIFSEVQKGLGAVPNVVVYNAFSMKYLEDSPLALTQAELEDAHAVNITSAYLAAAEAVRGFETLPNGLPKSFIYTGNGFNQLVVPAYVGLGIGKSASANWIEGASIYYGPKGYTFYYADERQPDGSFAGTGLSGEAAGEFYYKLAETQEQGPWLATFVKGVGYVKSFPIKL